MNNKHFQFITKLIYSCEIIIFLNLIDFEITLFFNFYNYRKREYGNLTIHKNKYSIYLIMREYNYLL